MAKNKKNGTSNLNGGDDVQGTISAASAKLRKSFKKAEDVRNRQKSSGSNSVGSKKSVAINDRTWYDKNPDMLKMCGTPKWFAYLGEQFNVSADYTSNPHVGQVAKAVVPGICRMVVHPGTGIARDANDAVNYMLQDVFLKVRKYNSHLTYAPADLAIYFEAMASPIAFFNFMCLIYALTNSDSPYNRYTQKAIIEAYGVDYEDLITNRPKLLYFINLFSVKCNKLRFPKEYGIYKYYANRFAHVVRDDISNHAQIYVTVPAGFYKYNPIANEYGGGLDFVRWINQYEDEPQLKTVEDIMAYANDMFEALWTDDDLYHINTDMAGSFSDSELYTLGTLTADAIVEFSDDEDYLTTIMNSDAVGMPVPGTDSITQQSDKFTLNYNPTFIQRSVNQNVLGSIHTKIVNSYRDRVPDELDMVEWTRYSAIPSREIISWDDTTGACAHTSYESLPLDVIETYDIFVFVYDSGRQRIDRTYPFTNILPIWNGNFTDTSATIQRRTTQALQILTYASAFNYFPILYITGYNKPLSAYTDAELSDSIFGEWKFIGIDNQIEVAGTLDPVILSHYNDHAQRALYSL